MKRMARAAAWLILIAMTALAPFAAASLKAGQENMVQKSRYSWTGVLRLWKCEGWQSGNGTLTAWLNECIAAFEKGHPGAYVQVTEVSAETMAAFMEASVNPPDMILYAPGMLEAPYSLMEMEESIPVKQTLTSLGLWQGARYAAPIALGGYAMAINSRLLPETTDNWSEATVPEGTLLNAPADGEYRSWSAALISLFAGSYAQEGGSERAPVGEGIDLGLATGAPEETAHPEKTEGMALIPNALPSLLPEDFRMLESVYSLFASGEIAAMPVTQREIRRLQLLSETGKAPDWRAEAMGLPFTDQAALFSIVSWPRKDIEERQSLCLELMRLMLSEEMQRKMTVSRAFPAREMAGLYQNVSGMREIESALNQEALLTAPAFGSDWREYADRLMDAIGAGGETQAAYGMLGQMLAGDSVP